jgi:omega-amidase
MNDLVICLLQNDLAWEDREKNLASFGEMIDGLESPADIILLPEMFNTGFSINPAKCAERMDGLTMTFLKEKAEERDCLLIGSLQVEENGRFYNRLVCMRPDGTHDYYDKRHLFILSDETKFMDGGSRRIIVKWKGWNILPLVCYDLRFPVWARNRFMDDAYEYDLLLFAANWPQSRAHVWRSLLVARAIENVAYVAGVNRTGHDYEGTPHDGGSMVVDPKGFIMADAGKEYRQSLAVRLPGDFLSSFRKKNPFATGWDDFELK